MCAIGIEQNDRRRPAHQCSRFRRTDLGIVADHIEIAGHQGERLVITLLALPQAGHGAGLSRIAGKVIAAKSLDRDDEALVEQAGNRIDIVKHAEGGILNRTAAESLKAHARTADMAGYRLRMKAPIGWILIFRAAGGT